MTCVCAAIAAHTMLDATVEVDAAALFKHHEVYVDAPDNLFILFPASFDFVVSAPTSNN